VVAFKKRDAVRGPEHLGRRADGDERLGGFDITAGEVDVGWIMLGKFEDGSLTDPPGS
jgi:hypothetical protein